MWFCRCQNCIQVLNLETKVKTEALSYCKTLQNTGCQSVFLIPFVSSRSLFKPWCRGDKGLFQLIISILPSGYCNLGQGVGDQSTKLSKLDFSLECFTADFLQFFTKNRQNLALRWAAGCSPSNPGISRFFLKLPNFLRPYALSQSPTREAARTYTFRW